MKQPQNGDSKPSPFGVNFPAPDNSQARKQIKAVVDRWADATRRRDTNEAAQCYAPVLERFYGKRNVSAEQWKRQQKQVLSQIGQIQKLEISNVKVQQENPNLAVVLFDKKWEFRGRSYFAGSAQDELILRPFQGQWKISSEREVKVYWTSKKPA